MSCISTVVSQFGKRPVHKTTRMRQHGVKYIELANGNEHTHTYQ